MYGRSLLRHGITNDCILLCTGLCLCFCIFPFNLRVASFNCHGIKTSNSTIQQMLCKQFDIILLQETWLYPDELSFPSNLSNQVCSFSLSSISMEEKLIRGRPHGGIRIMWRKTLSNGVKIVQYDDNRMLGLELKTIDFTLLLLSQLTHHIFLLLVIITLTYKMNFFWF